MRFKNLIELQKIFEGIFEPVPRDRETGLTPIKISFIPRDVSLFKPHIPPKVYNALIKYLIDANVTPLTWWPFKLVKATLNYWERLSQGNIRFDLFYRRLTPKDNVFIILGCTTPELPGGDLFHFNYRVKNIRLLCLNKGILDSFSAAKMLFALIIRSTGIGPRDLIEQCRLLDKLIMRIDFHELGHALGLPHPKPEQQLECNATIMAYPEKFCRSYQDCMSSGTSNAENCRLKHAALKPGPIDERYMQYMYGNRPLNYFRIFRQSLLESGMHGVVIVMLKNSIYLIDMASTKLINSSSRTIKSAVLIKLVIKMMLGMLMCVGTISNVYQLYKNYKLYVALTYVFAPHLLNKAANYLSKKYNTLSESVSFALITTLISILQKQYPIAVEEIGNLIGAFLGYYGTSKATQIVVKKIQQVYTKKQIKTQPSKTPTSIADLLKTHGLFRGYKFENLDTVCAKLKEVEITEQNKDDVAQMIFNATHYYKSKMLYRLLTCSFFCSREIPVYCNTAALTT